MSFVGKVILCGSAGAGKTSILARYVDGHFFEEYKQTIGANFLIKEIDLTRIIDDIKIKDEKINSARSGWLTRRGAIYIKEGRSLNADHVNFSGFLDVFSLP